MCSLYYRKASTVDIAIVTTTTTTVTTAAVAAAGVDRGSAMMDA